MEIFLESFKWNVEKNAAPGGRLQCDPCQWRQIEDKSTQGGSISDCEYLFRDMFQTVDNILWIYPYERSSGVQAKVKERDCEDFLKIKNC